MIFLYCFAITSFLRIASSDLIYVGMYNVIYNNVTTHASKGIDAAPKPGRHSLEIIWEMPLERVWLAMSFVLSKHFNDKCLVFFIFLF